MDRLVIISGSLDRSYIFERLQEISLKLRAAFMRRVRIDRLPADVAELIRASVPARTRSIRPDQLRTYCSAATELAVERARTAREEIQAIELEICLEQVRAKASFLGSLSDKERGLYETRVQAIADAQARAAHDCERMARHIATLEHELAETQRTLQVAEGALGLNSKHVGSGS